MRFLNISSVLFPFYYYPLEFILKNDFSINTGDNIIIGNSASANNNHLEVFEILKSFDIEDRKIIIPLNYGNFKYADYVESKGLDVFGNKLYVLKDFLSLNDYNKVLGSCSIAIMNHFRQQAFGNLIALIYKGVKLYLSEKNVLYRFAKNNGLFVFSIEQELKVENKKALVALTEQERNHNRQIIYSLFNEKKLIEQLIINIENHFN